MLYKLLKCKDEQRSIRVRDQLIRLPAHRIVMRKGGPAMPPIELSEKDFKTLLKEYRGNAHMTQADLGDLLGFDSTYIGKVENGQRYPTSREPSTKEAYGQRVRILADNLERQHVMTRLEREDFLQAWERDGEHWLIAHPSKRRSQPKRSDEVSSGEDTTGSGHDSAQPEDATTRITASPPNQRSRWFISLRVQGLRPGSRVWVADRDFTGSDCKNSARDVGLWP